MQAGTYVSYVRTNGDVVQGKIERMSEINGAVYIRDVRTGNIVAAPLNRVKAI